MEKYRIGIDVGSTTAKIVVLDPEGNRVFCSYRRHHANITKTVCEMLDTVNFDDINAPRRKEQDSLGTRLGESVPAAADMEFRIGVTGSIGMGIAGRAGLCFVQEVVAASKAVPLVTGHKVSSMIDIGGEDSKVVFFDDKGMPSDLRMNGNCAAGTGSFIDQMSVILDEPIEALSDLALQATHVYPIASRCGVFCKTDIQNLVAKNVCKADIAASIFHAVAVQTVVTLAHGFDITPPVLFCGGPLTFIPALRKQFTDYLGLTENDVLIPDEGKFLPAIGAALGAGDEEEYSICELKSLICGSVRMVAESKNALPPIFSDEEQYAGWRRRIGRNSIRRQALTAGPIEVFLGIDSGSTTTKVAFTDREGNLLFQYYAPNSGDPIGTARKGIEDFREQCEAAGAEPTVKGGCSTGYGEDLIKAAFRLQYGIIETIAHYMAAHRLDPEVSFILDIGGQDMKAIYVDHGVINRIEINEACSSGCGSFIETFATSLGYKVADFAHIACTAAHPCDLGTRCTVFMNSKVKQVLREGFIAADIAAGLANSVVRNCLYKVLKLKDTSSLGNHIVVQGGTMKNDAVVRSLELLSGANVSRSDAPEMMGAYGCCLFAIKNA